ncbi:MAG TPA: hypothetical protein VL947_10135, partial [Cytophagales bacterium]|nr:hypothetical protein [Cytophagales bacterium]
IEDLYLGHVNRDLEALQNTTIQQLLPEFDNTAQQGMHDVFKIKETLDKGGEVEVFEHHLLPDAIYKGIYWGFAYKI